MQMGIQSNRNGEEVAASYKWSRLPKVFGCRSQAYIQNEHFLPFAIFNSIKYNIGL